ncbi:hypothetical protein MMC15_000567 [Xylographa vitiligo]|nr:hypothetical protein [Xylographa vitiligo]
MDVQELKDIIHDIQEYLIGDGNDTKKEDTRLQEKPILSLFGIHSTKYMKSKPLVEMLGTLTALIAIPQKRLTDTEQLLHFARDAFRDSRTDMDVKMSTEFVHMVSRSELVEELKVGAQAITGSLHRIEEERKSCRSTEDEHVEARAPTHQARGLRDLSVMMFC